MSKTKTSAECPTCHRPFDRTRMFCGSCDRPIKKNHRWRVQGSTVRHIDCKNVRMVPMCEEALNGVPCILEAAHAMIGTPHVTEHGVTWSVSNFRLFSGSQDPEELPDAILPAGWEIFPQSVKLRDPIRIPERYEIEVAENEGMPVRGEGWDA